MMRRDLLIALAGALSPSALYAQPRTRDCRLGLLVLLSVPRGKDPLIDHFLGALNDRGWSLGRNLHVDIRETAPQQHRAAEMLEPGEAQTSKAQLELQTEIQNR